ncbi:MAG TPA: glycogen debranching protein GlgX [Polyangiaceae bacterium]|nr:glycogen debranching protein GlgX [Polyangiaceae bacterium]
MEYTLRPGHPFPLGATPDALGVNFAVFSAHGTGVDLCLFDEANRETRIPLRERSAHVYHGHVEGVRAGQRYGYRVFGPYEPRSGHRFNPNKLLVDPYARAVHGKVDYAQPVFGYARESGRDDLTPSLEDSAAGVPRSVVVDPSGFDWGGDAAPDVSWADTVLYETHVKGLTMLHPAVPPELRGTYEGLAHPAVLDHLVSLGVTTVELLPVHEHADEHFLFKRGLTNYWGYSTLSYFAPSARFARVPGRQVDEFRAMVKGLHAAGLEVVLDVVYNHTCEGDRLGPTLSLRGFDNRSYYRLKPGDLREYEDFTGCGNSLDMMCPQSLKLVMDSLRYFVTEMHVDGFRFDLASTLARELQSVDKMSGFFDIIHQDPVLSRVKLIAEPWDLGEGGYQVGNFPVLWTEWNGRYRDTVRRFWTGDKRQVGDMGFRLTGSSDLYERDGRHPQASINFLTAHDGFTLRDLVSYERKRNFDNREENRDGTDDNASWNCGVEGETEDPEVLELRARQARNLMLTLGLSLGVPMLTAGDELWKTQRGNNNPYAQDNAISWVDWGPTPEGDAQHAFTRLVFELRARHPVFRRRRFLRGVKVGLAPDIAWFRPDGAEMVGSDWSTPGAPLVAWLLAGDALAYQDERGAPVEDDTFLVIMSSMREASTFTLPAPDWGKKWTLVLDTAVPGEPEAAIALAGDVLDLLPCHAVVYRRDSKERGSFLPLRSARPVEGGDP